MKFKVTKAVNNTSPADQGENNFPTLSSRTPNKPSENATAFGNTEKRVQVFNVCGDSHDAMGAANNAAWGFGSSFPKTGDIIEGVDGKAVIMDVIAQVNNSADWGEKGRDYSYTGGYFDGDLSEGVCVPVNATGKIMVWGCYDLFNDAYAYGKHLFFLTTYYMDGGQLMQMVDIVIGSDIVFSLPPDVAPVSPAEVLAAAGATNLDKPIYMASISYSVGVSEIEGLGMFPAVPQQGGNMPSPGYGASMVFGLEENSKQIFIQESSDGPGPGPGPWPDGKPPMSFDFDSPYGTYPPFESVIPFVNYTFPIGVYRRK